MTQKSRGPGKEKRRHTRRTAAQTAQIHFGESAAIPCEIRDYCPTGLYVAFAGEVTPGDALPALLDTPVEVAFAVAHSGTFRFGGRVARVAPGGLGIFVATMPEDALQALRTASERSTRSDTVGGVAELSPQQGLVLQQECTGQFFRFLDAVMQEFFQRAVERLGEAGQDEPGFLERSRYDNGAQELLQHRSRIEDDFFKAMRDRIKHVDPVRDAAAPAANALSLVGETEFEDWLNLSAVIKQIELDFNAQLYAFGQRYSRLVGLPIDRKNNPFGPDVIGHTFQSAILDMDFSNPVRAHLYQALGQAISSHAPALYPKLNQVLTALQPPEPVREKMKPAPSVAVDTPAADSGKAKLDLAEIAATLDKLYQQDRAGVSLAPDKAEYSLDRILAGLNASQRATADAPAHYAGSSPAGQPARPRPEVLQVVGRLQQAARQLAGREGSAPPHPAAVPAASLSQLLMALDGLPLASPAAPGSAPLPPLSDRLDARIAAAGEAVRLAPEHRQILDATSNLLGRAWADFVPGSDVASLMERLERPLLKLALQAPDFPAMPDHPARQVLNLVEQYAVAADDKGRFFDAKLQRFLDLLVDRICIQADSDPGIFEGVRDSLEKVLAPILQIRRTRVARLQEASEGRERIRVARTRVNAALEQRLAGREVPASLLRLLDAGWRQHLVLLEMREGAQGEAWDAALAVLDVVFDWLGPAAAPLPAGTVQALLNRIERTLATVNVDAKLLAAFMGELEAEAGDRGADAGRAMVRVPPGRLAPPPSEYDLTAQRQWRDRLRVGGWWDFSQDGSQVPMQLIWISQPPTSCAFANRSATHKLEFTLTELSRQIQRGLAQPGKEMELPLIDRTEHALFDETYRDMVHQAMHDPLTGLLNRKGFMHRLNQLALPDQADQAHAVGIIEFDQFRMIYNSCGVDAAEALARSLAGAAGAQLGPDAVLAAFRDDTLALLLPNCSRAGGCDNVDSLLDRVKDYPFQHGQHRYSIGFNVGITEYAPARFSAAEAIRRADSACITAKAMGRNRKQVYEETNPQLQSQESLIDWAGRIDSFLNGSGLHLRCQQVMPLGTDTSLRPYYEILLGIEGEDGLVIEPAHFIPTVERLQRSHEVDIWVMQNVFAWIGANLPSFASLGGFAINLSATSLSSPDVMRYLQKVLPNSDFPTDKITFEITESAAIESYGAAQDFIREIRRYGCKFSLDDFGSGFTSYAHLKNLRTDTLKIDGSFVRDMLNNPDDYAMVKSMNDIGHSLGLCTVAEFVESPEIRDALREIGVDYAQGYAIHKPCRIDELARASGEE
jgi:diguanylate cyclase (GGDEF)-like protein